MTATVMIQGTGSDVGKSLLVAGLGRAFSRRGLRVRPFKPQNMSNNAAVAADGGEIGRAQALQARACGVAPVTDMNPVLLKPESETGAQIVVGGVVRGRTGARRYHALKETFLPAVLESYRRLADEADLVLVEGAGGAAEINLRAGDIANMGFAEAADVPVLLVGDIERGGVIASLVGTYLLLPENERARLKGFIVNKFRGDPTLFDGGVSEIFSRTGMAWIGTVPALDCASRLPAEDAMALDQMGTGSTLDRPIRIAVPRLSRMANFDDLDALRLEADVALAIVAPGEALPGDADLVILGGTKSTLADLAFLRAQGWDIDLLAHRRRGGRVLGLCGGYQMLGRLIADPDGVDGAPGTVDGLGLLDIETVMGGDKAVKRASATHVMTGEAVSGYEIHNGRTVGPDCDRPMLTIDGRPEGAVSSDGSVAGCYLHGLFAADGFRHAMLASLRPERVAELRYEHEVEAALDALASALEVHLDLDRVQDIANGK